MVEYNCYLRMFLSNHSSREGQVLKYFANANFPLAQRCFSFSYIQGILTNYLARYCTLKNKNISCLTIFTQSLSLNCLAIFDRFIVAKPVKIFVGLQGKQSQNGFFKFKIREGLDNLDKQLSLGLLYLYSLQGILNRFETFCMIVSQCYVMTVQITAASKKKIFFFLPFHAQLNPQLFLLLYYTPFTKLKIKYSHSLKPHYSPSVLDGKICGSAGTKKNCGFLF